MSAESEFHRQVEVACQFLNCLYQPEDLCLLRPIVSWTESNRKRSQVLYKDTGYVRPHDAGLPLRVAAFLELSAKKQANLYVGVCPRFGDGQKYDNAWQIRTVRCLWADLDHCSTSEALQRIEAAGLPRPSVLVNSGNGAHVYWLLDRPYSTGDDVPPPVLLEWPESQAKKTPRRYLEGPGERLYLDCPANVPDLSEAAVHLQDILSGIAGAIGGDHTFDLSRILRLPGSFNRKDERNGKAPIATELVICEPDRRYPLSEFEYFAAKAPSRKQRLAIEQIALPAPRKLTPKRKDALSAAIDRCRVETKGARSEADFAACCIAIELGVVADDLWRQVADIGKFAEAGRAYFDRTWKRAADKVRRGIYVDLTGAPILESGESRGECCDDDELPEVVLDVDEARVADEVIKAMSHLGLVYQRGGLLTQVQSDCPSPPGVERLESAVRIVPLGTPRVRELITLSAKLIKYTEEGPKDRHPPEWLVRAVHGRGEWQHIPPIVGIVQTPVMTATGDVLEAPGYDSHSGLYYAPRCEFPRVPQKPHRDDARAACEALLEVICDMPFTRPEHRLGWLAAMITPAARFAYHGPAPLFAFDANAAGSGKSLAADTIGYVHTGDRLPRTSFPADDEEMRKRITSIALAGEPLVLLDNINRPLGGAALDAALTATSWSDRILGRSEMTGSIPLTTVWFATGNNLVLADDTPRRTLHMRIDCLQEDPEARKDFKHPNLLEWVRQERGRLAVAVTTILRAYHLAGRPDQSLPEWGSYEAWSRLVRHAIVWCGYDDPAKSRLEFKRSLDRDATELQLFMAAWDEVDPQHRGVTTSNALKAAGPHHEAMNAIAAVFSKPGEPANVRTIGMKLHHMQGRVCGGRRFVRTDSKAGAVWRVETIGESAQIGQAGLGGTRGTSGTKTTPSCDSRKNDSSCFPIHTVAAGISPSSPASPPAASTACNHIDPESWVVQEGRALCPGCGRFMGRAPAATPAPLAKDQF